MHSQADLLVAQATELAFLKAALHEVGAYIFTKDLNGCYTYANNQVLDLFNASLNDVMGKDDSHFFDLEISNQLRINDRRVMDHGETIESEEINIIKKPLSCSVVALKILLEKEILRCCRRKLPTIFGNWSKRFIAATKNRRVKKPLLMHRVKSAITGRLKYPLNMKKVYKP